MAGLTLSAIRKSFDGTEVLKGIDLDVEDGRFVVFVGPSGCGKSTLLRVIAGLEEVDSGEVAIGGVAMNGVPPAKRGVAMVFQSYALYPHMTVAQNMGFALRLAGRPREEIDAAVTRAAQRLDIAHLLDRTPKTLSGGQRQRVAIGRAIVRAPGVFLFDEPLSNLDAELRVRMRYEFAKLHGELDATMIYVTHDQVEAMTLADTIVVLNQGRIAQAGEPLDLYDHPKNRFVAGFIGSPRMNFLPGELIDATASGARMRLANGAEVSAQVDASRAKAGEAATLGIRPEHIAAGGQENALKAEIRFVEKLGSQTFAYANVDGLEDDMTLQLPGEMRLSAKARLTLSLPAAQCHLFDADGAAFGRL
jgi:multiple sugar transport system ATP-binding protein